MTKFDNRISWGQVITLIVLVSSLIAQYSLYGRDAIDARDMAESNRKRIIDLEKRDIEIKAELIAIKKSVEFQTKILISISEKMGIRDAH